jgi:hypothetical protein
MSCLRSAPTAAIYWRLRAKAGYSVTAVESSEVHRKFIRDIWGIDSVYSDISALPTGLKFDPMSRLLTALGRAGSVKARLVNAQG